MTPALLTEPQAAEQLGVSRWWLARMRKAALIPHSSPGPGTVRYSEADLTEITRRLRTPAKKGR